MLCKETENGFGSPVLLTSGKHISGGFNAYYNDDALVLITNEIDADTLASSIRVYQFNNQPDLRIENVYYDQYTLMEGGELRTTIKVKNNGFESVDGYILRAYANNELLFDEEMQNILLPGHESDDEIQIGLPSSIDFNQIEFTIEYLKQGESVATEPYTLSLLLQDVSLENAIIVSDNDAANLSVSVVNRGISELSDITVYLHKGSENGEMIDSYNILQISSREEVVVQFDVSDYVSDETRFYVTTEPLENEKNIANNSDFAVCTEFIENEIFTESVFDLYESIIINEEKTLVIDDESAPSVVIFQPTDNGTYSFNFSSDFYSNSVIKDANGTELDSQYGYNYDIGYELVGGNIYYIETKPYWDDSGEYTVFVEKLVRATAISIDKGENYSGYVNTGLYLNIIFSPETAMEEEIVWTTSDPSVVSVDEYGYARLLKEGIATITATSENDLIATCSISVEDYPTITTDESKTVELDQDNPNAYFYFTPDEDGYYAFYSNSDADTYGYVLDSDFNQLNYDDDSGDDNNFRVGYHMEAGTTYILQASFYSTSTDGSFEVAVEKSRYITALEITSLPDKMEYIKGYVSDNLDYDGLKLKATWSDGSTIDWVMNDDDYYIGDQRVYVNSSNVNEDGIIRITCGEKEVTYTLTLIENPVDHLNLISGTSNSYIENYNGYVTENDDGEYFHYDTNSPGDAVIEIVYKDGSSITANVGDYIEGYSIDWESNQYDEPWIVGTDNKSTISYLGHTVNLPITVEKNKVESIEVMSGKVTCIENTYGYEMDDGYYYDYNVPSDITMKINYTDDTSKTVGIRDTVDGYRFSWDDDQYETPWVLGDDNYITLSYLGVETQLPVSVIANPVDRIEVNAAPTREYIYGDTEYGYLYSDGDYEFYPTDMTGLSFTVYYTDNTSKTFTYDDIDENDNINGYGYSLYYDEYNPEIGNFPVTFEYMGKSADYTVVLKESTVASIAVTKKLTKTEYTNDYSPDFIGMEVTIAYTDNTTKTVTLTEDNLIYEYNPWEGLSYKTEIDGYTLNIEPYYGDDMYYMAYYLGASCEIKNITFTESKEIDSVDLDNVSWNGDGMIINVTYADETTETLTFDMIEFYNYEDSSVAGYGRTKNGLLYYHIETYKDKDGNVKKYKVTLLDEEIAILVGTTMIGDVNTDGGVTISDVVLILRWLAGNLDDQYIDHVEADVDADGDLTTADAIAILRHVMGEVSLYSAN